MKDLSEKLASLNFKNIKTYIQSGNIVFDATGPDQSSLAQLISQTIKKEFSLSIPTIIITKEQLMRAISFNPFLEKGPTNESRLVHLFFSAQHARSS